MRQRIPKSRVRWILLTLLLAEISTTTCDATVYKWQDAAGYVQSTDTPPTAGGTLLNGPVATKTAGADQDKPMMHEWCGMDMSPANCQMARKALQQDYEDLACTRSSPNGNSCRYQRLNRTGDRPP